MSVHLAVPAHKFPIASDALYPELYQGGAVAFKTTYMDALAALLSSEESYPALATMDCNVHIIHMTIPSNIFMTGVLTGTIEYTKEAYSGNRTLKWSSGDYTGCDVTVTTMLVGCMGIEQWAQIALGRWYSCRTETCQTCWSVQPKNCWAGRRADHFGGIGPRCAECWHGLYHRRCLQTRAPPMVMVVEQVVE